MSDIKWNVEKKEKRDRERAERRIKEKVGRAYTRWKQSLLGRNTSGTQTLSEYLAKLRVDVMNELAGSGLDSYQDFTESLLNEIYARVRKAEELGTLKTADVDRAMPNQLHLGDHTVAFHSEEELYDVPEIRVHMGKATFGGLVVHVGEGGKIALQAVHIGEKSSYSLHTIGLVRTSKGLGKFPSVQQYMEAAGRLSPDSETPPKGRTPPASSQGS